MPAYDRAFDPPAPVAEIVIVDPGTDVRSGILLGKLDTGAGVTVIPETLVAELGLVSQGRVWARSYDGTYSERPTYYTRMILSGNDLRAVRCIAANRQNVLVARNVLNRFVLTLDGPNLRFELRRTA